MKDIYLSPHMTERNNIPSNWETRLAGKEWFVSENDIQIYHPTGTLDLLAKNGLICFRKWHPKLIFQYPDIQYSDESGHKTQNAPKLACPHTKADNTSAKNVVSVRLPPFSISVNTWFSHAEWLFCLQKIIKLSVKAEHFGMNLLPNPKTPIFC